MKSFTPTAPEYFISTHLDDVALSCSHYLAEHPGLNVVTVMAGAPDVSRSDEWNAVTTGISYAPDAVKRRRDEDVAAMKRLQTKPSWLNFWDSPYLNGKAQDESKIAAELKSLVKKESVKSLIAPLGLHHSDHVAVSNAAIKLLTDNPGIDLYFYLDMPYGVEWPAEAEERLRNLKSDNLSLEKFVPVVGEAKLKLEVFKEYESQFTPIKKAFGNFDAAMSAPEHYWKAT